MRQFAVIIPARLLSFRLPGKMLLSETGQPLILHTVQNALTMGAGVVAVASDSMEILHAVENDCLAILTGDIWNNGTERLSEAIEARELAAYDVFVNVQGDEPELPGNAAEAAVEALEWATCGTVASRQLVRFDHGTRISRSEPNPKAPDCPIATAFDRKGPGVLHHGVYAYRRKTLEWYAAAARTDGEARLSLEQLRFIEHGRHLAYKKIAYQGHPVDDRETYAAFVERFSQGRQP